MIAIFNNKSQGVEIACNKQIATMPAGTLKKTFTTLHATWMDDGTKVVAQVEEIPLTTVKPVTLWEGQDYINIGQWTDAQAKARLLEVL